MMPDWLQEVGRIWLSVAFAAYGLVVMMAIRRYKYHRLYRHVLMFACFITSGIVLFNSTVLRLPGWPATLTALSLSLMLYGTYMFHKGHLTE